MAETFIEQTKRQFEQKDFAIDQNQFESQLNTPESIQDLFLSIQKTLDATDQDGRKILDSITDTKQISALINVLTFLNSKFTPEQHTQYSQIVSNYLSVLKAKGAKTTDVISASTNIPSEVTAQNFDAKLAEITDATLDQKQRDTKSIAFVDALLQSSDKALIGRYFALLSSTSLAYLGTSRYVQISNYRKITQSEHASLLSDAQKSSLKQTLEQVDMKSTTTDLIREFGAILLDVIEFFGGKGALRSICSKFKINYDEYFGELEKLYDQKYGLSSDQSAALTGIYQNAQSEPKPYIKDNALNIDQTRIDYKTWGVANIGLLDPLLVQRAAKSANLNIPNLLLEDGQIAGQKKYKLNIPAISQPNAEAIMDKLLDKNSALRSNLTTLVVNDTKIKESIYGPSDATAKSYAGTYEWEKKSLVGKVTNQYVAVGAYLMKGGAGDFKYVLSENDMPYEADYKEPVKTEVATQSGDQGAEKIEEFWKQVFDRYSTGEFKNFITKDPSKLSPNEKSTYKKYQESLKADMQGFFDLSPKDLGILMRQKSQDILKTFLITYIPAYLTIDSVTEDLASDKKTKITFALEVLKKMKDAKNPLITFSKDNNSVVVSGDRINSKNTSEKISLDFSELTLIFKTPFSTKSNTDSEK